MRKVEISTQCPNCGKSLELSADINPIDLAPTVRGKLRPIGDILVYKVNSEEIKAFIIQKARHFVPDVRIEVVPRYCEKKRQHKNDPHRSYASLRIAFSENIVEHNDDHSWYEKIGESSDNMRIVKSMFEGLIQLYGYNPKHLDAWLKSYKNLEELEECLGMNEAYINDLRTYVKPRRITDANKENWIIFSAAAENVLQDMLLDPVTKKVPGKIQIQDVYPISKDIVEFIVYLHPEALKSRENPHVRQILMGEERPKKG